MLTGAQFRWKVRSAETQPELPIRRRGNQLCHTSNATWWCDKSLSSKQLPMYYMQLYIIQEWDSSFLCRLKLLENWHGPRLNHVHWAKQLYTSNIPFENIYNLARHTTVRDRFFRQYFWYDRKSDQIWFGLGEANCLLITLPTYCTSIGFLPSISLDLSVYNHLSADNPIVRTKI